MTFSERAGLALALAGLGGRSVARQSAATVDRFRGQDDRDLGGSRGRGLIWRGSWHGEGAVWQSLHGMRRSSTARAGTSRPGEGMSGVSVVTSAIVPQVEDAILERIVAEYGGIDVLINDAASYRWALSP